MIVLIVVYTCTASNILKIFNIYNRTSNISDKMTKIKLLLRITLFRKFANMPNRNKQVEDTALLLFCLSSISMIIFYNIDRKMN